MGVGIQNELEYRFNFLSRLFFSSVPIIVNIFVWSSISNFSKNNFGYSLKEIVSYYIIVFFIGNIIQCDIQWLIANNIKLGDINKYLIKTISYMAFRFYFDFSKRIVYIVIMLFPMAIMCIVYRNYLPILVDFKRITFFIVALFCGYTVNFLLSFIIGEYSFYFSEVTSLFSSYNVLKNIVSGNIFPLSIIPKQVYQILMITPFQFLGYFPAMILMNRFTQKEIINNLVLGFVWILVLFLSSRFIWRKGLSKYSAFGG
jgi:ABC-2 type transport system permease protein